MECVQQTLGVWERQHIEEGHPFVPGCLLCDDEIHGRNNTAASQLIDELNKRIDGLLDERTELEIEAEAQQEIEIVVIELLELLEDNLRSSTVRRKVDAKKAELRALLKI